MAQKIRIAILGCRGIPSTYSGNETFIGELAPRLAAKGHEVTVYCRRSFFPDRPSLYRGTHLRHLPSWETKNFGTLTHTAFSMLDAVFRNFDILFIVNPGNGFHCILPRLLGKRLVMNMDGLEWKRGKWGPVGRAYFKLAACCATIFCQEIVNDSLEMQKIYRQEFNTPSTYIPYGADIETSRNPKPLKKYGVEPCQYYLVASRLAPETYPDLIAQAFTGVKTNKKLIIAGEPNYRSPLLKKLKAIRDPRIKLLGHIDNPEDYRELNCNCYAYIHGHSVGGTNPSLLKALGFGNCILAFDVPFNREVLLDYGLYFSEDERGLTEKIQYLEDNPEVVERYRRRAPERIRQAFTWEKITDQYEELFLRLISG